MTFDRITGCTVDDADPCRCATENRSTTKACAIGSPTYPATGPRSHTIHNVLTTRPPHVHIAGRVTALTTTDAHLVLWITDGSDHHHPAEIRATADADWRGRIRVGDIVSCYGTVGGLVPPDLQLEGISILSRDLRCDRTPPPSDARDNAQHWSATVRSSGHRQHLIDRATLAATVRTVLTDARYLEIDTPILRKHPTAHFEVTTTSIPHRVAMRPGPTLLKSMLAAGLDQVFELYRAFRDEPIDDTHAIEYSLIELYAAYADYEVLKPLTQRLLREAALRINGDFRISTISGEVIDLAADWPTITVHDAVAKATGTTFEPDIDCESATAIARRLGLKVSTGATADDVTLCLYDTLVEPKAMRPTFFTDFPASTSIMARQHRTLPLLAEKWDLVIGGREIGSAYTELIDPGEQRLRLDGRSPSAYEGAHIDESHLRLLDSGLPPCAGLVLGFERILMTLTGAVSIHDVIPFPLRTAEHIDNSTPLQFLGEAGTHTGRR